MVGAPLLGARPGTMTPDLNLLFGNLIVLTSCQPETVAGADRCWVSQETGSREASAKFQHFDWLTIRVRAGVRKNHGYLMR